jgi:fumarate reductase flavoprotein subunit
MLHLALLAGCDSSGAHSGPPDSAGDSGAAITFDATYDVIVVGSGPAGSAAVIEAADAGADVVLFEREEVPGFGVRMAGQGYGVATPWQEERGIEDSVALAQSEWTTTTGADGHSESVTAYIEGTSATLSWLAGRSADIGLMASAAGEGGVARIHAIGWPGEGTAFEQLMGETPFTLRAGVEVTGPVMEEGAVVGVTWRVMATGETGATAARGGVVVATGGFLRNLDAVEAVRPDLAALDPIFETMPSSTGGGLPLFEAVGAGRESPERIGAYVHSVEDPRFTTGEAMILFSHVPYILVGADGRRFSQALSFGSLSMIDALPDGGAWFVAAVAGPADLGVGPPRDNWAEAEVVEFYTFSELVEFGSTELVADPDLSVAATVAGVDEAIVDEVEAYNALAASGREDEYGDVLEPEDALIGPWWTFARFRPGLAKNFGGVSTDPAARVTTPGGDPILGLWAAGECVGMVPGGGSGQGFTGSATALYYGGRLAGAAAAARASNTPAGE